MENGYRNLLERFMKVRWVAFIIVAVCGVIIWITMSTLQSEIAPLEDKSSIRFNVTPPEGTSFPYMQKITDQIADYLYDSVPERDFVFARVGGGFGGSNSSQPRIGLISPKERERSQDQIANDLQRKLGRFNDARIFATQEQTIAVGAGSRGGLPVQFVLQNMDFDKLRQVIPQFLDAARQDPTFSNVDVNLKFNRPEIQLSVDRMKAKDLGLSTQDVVAAIQAAFSGGRLAYFIMGSDQYQVIAQVSHTNRTEPSDISRLYVRNAGGREYSFKRRSAFG
jgi:HAE1 family hydrophobic/amphiphilic exporter-1/multidrug efflux pump